MFVSIPYVLFPAMGLTTVTTLMLGPQIHDLIFADEYHVPCTTPTRELQSMYFAPKYSQPHSFLHISKIHFRFFSFAYSLYSRVCLW